ncbi:hypothetical protein CcrBL47_gp550 [Caulobacter phage BL47]|nr:hypothetical protein CcrBL47_gp034 [Caulobacter phage BL47]UTU09832.1 hypothetical protein CcrBL47_gp550 [Caulobacter phage BL47]
MSYSGPITISQGLRWRLDSYGNGAAYALYDLSAGASVWIDGDDATTFREALDTVEAQRPQDEPDEILGHLWDEHDYGAAATVQVVVVRRVIREDTVIALRPGETEAQAKERAIFNQSSLKWDTYDCEYSADPVTTEPAAEYDYLRQLPGAI